ncbi:MAG: hypothetical protein KDI68_04050 [Gammaproteobacteria bacterium]|nr:hypothetical protein [Gammaproteobacteria bacterium]
MNRAGLDTAFQKHITVYWANLSRLNNLLIVLNITLFFLTGLIARGYFYTFYSIGCFSVVAILSIIPAPWIDRLWFYLVNLALEFVGLYFLLISIVHWVRMGAEIVM